jgi:hypothetical protein
VSLTLQESAALVGGHCWVERRLFERLGAWVAPTAWPAAKLALDRHAQHAAWRAAQWWDRLPVLAQVDREALVVAPSSWAGLAGSVLAAAPAAPADPVTPADPAPALEATGAGPDPLADATSAGGADVARLAVAYRILLPRLAVAYQRHVQLTSAVADGPVVRTLGQALADIRADWAEGEGIVQDLVVDERSVAAASAATARVEARFAC